MNWKGLFSAALGLIKKSSDTNSGTSQLVDVISNIIEEPDTPQIEEDVVSTDDILSKVDNRDPNEILEEDDLDNLERLLREAMFKKNYRGLKVLDGPFKKAIQSFSYELVNNDALSEFCFISKVTDTPTFSVLKSLLLMKKSGNFVFLKRVSNGYSKVNADVVDQISNMLKSTFPTPLAKGVLEQETELKLYKSDNYPIVGLDFNDKEVPYRITSRGLFLSQRTIFHYPIALNDFNKYQDLNNDMEFLFDHLKGKYDSFIVSDDYRKRDDLRYLGFKDQPLRPCQYNKDDPRYFKDCKSCLESISKKDYKNGKSVIGVSGKWVLKPTIYHKEKSYSNMPDFKKFPCDFIYAIRRYNGGGINSFHYLMKVIKKILS